MKEFKKSDFPVERIRKFLEPGPIVLVSSKWKNETNIMTMGWHTVMEFAPSLVGCIIADSNYSHDLIRKSGECMINLPTTELTNIVVKIGNSDGDKIDKFEKFGLTAEKAKKVGAPLIRECYANFECKIYDDSWVRKYNFFVFEVVYAHVASSPKNPKTLHYTGDGKFMISGGMVNKRAMFRKDRLRP